MGITKPGMPKGYLVAEVVNVFLEDNPEMDEKTLTANIGRVIDRLEEVFTNYIDVPYVDKRVTALKKENIELMNKLIKLEALPPKMDLREKVVTHKLELDEATQKTILAAAFVMGPGRGTSGAYDKVKKYVIDKLRGN